MAALLAGCTVEPEHPALRHAKLPPLIPAHRLAYHGNVNSGYLLSPDGRKLAWTGPSFGRSVLHVRDNATGVVRKYRVGGTVQWTPDGRWLLYVADTTGTESHHVYAVDTEAPASEPVDLTPWPGVKAGIQQTLPAEPGRVLIYHNRRDPGFFDLYRIDLASRQETLVAQNPGDATAPITTADGGFVGWQKSREVQRRAVESPRPLAMRKPALLKKPEETFRSLGLGADRRIAWALSDRGRDRVALVAVDSALGWERVLFADPETDVDKVVMSRVNREPMLAQADPGYPRIAFLDPKLRADLDGLLKAQGAGPYGLEILNTDHAEKRLIVSIYTDSRRSYYLFDRESRTYVLLAEAVERDLAASLAPMRPITIASSDGLRLHGYLTLPRGAAPRRLPTVVYVHGGPWMRTRWGDPTSSDDAVYAQFLANRGYAVLQVDFRGSSGYGRAFMNAGIGEFAGRMQEDLLDAVRWAIDGGIADPARIAIMGWSYGGYAALVGLSMTPETFACGISISGPTDLASLIDLFPPYWKVDLSRWQDFVGDPAIPEDREEMAQKSPLSHAREIVRPVLVIHGVRDVRVRVDQADRMVAALRAAGKQVEYLRIPDMGHDTGWWVHQLAVLRSTEHFLQGCLGGRASRFDWFDPLAWAWWRISRWREGSASPPAQTGTQSGRPR
jgi:dipeptidyl aminopeptidase/acylaminoacyl peptidase